MLDKIKSLASDTAVYGFFTIIGRFLAFLLYPLYSNFLVKSELGEISYLFAIIAFMNIMYSFGMETAFFRFFSKTDKEYSKTVFTHSFLTISIISFTTSLIIFLFSGTLAPRLISSANSVNLIRLAAFIPFLDALILIPYASLRMTRRAKLFALTRLIIIVVNILFNLVLVAYLKLGAMGVFIANISSSLVGVIIFLPMIISNISLKYDKSLLKSMLRFGIPTIPANFSAIILQVADKPIMKWLAGAEQLAVYSVNYKLGIPMMMFVTIFEYAWKPFYLSHHTEPDAKRLFSRVLTYFTMISSLIFLIIAFFIDLLVKMPFIGGRLINPDYWVGLSIVPIILGGYYFNGVFSNFAAGCHITKRTEFLPVAVGISAILNIILNLFMIPVFGIWGGAWATFIAYLVSSIILYFLTFRIYPLKYEWKRLAIIIVVTIAVYFGGMALCSGLDTYLAVLIKTGFIIGYLMLLLVTGFFTKGEMAGLRQMISRRKS